MKLVAVEEKVPEAKGHHNLQKLIKDFANSDAKAVKIVIEDGEYVSIHSAHNTWMNAVKLSKRPIRVHKAGDELYLVKSI